MKVPRYISILATIFVLLAFAVYFALNTNKFRPLLHIDWLFLIFIAVLDIAAIAVNGLFTKLILKPFHKEISILESFFVSLISSVGNFFAPAGAGLGFRAVYLKRRHGLSYKDYITILSGNYVIVFLTSSLIGIISLYLLRSRADHQWDVLLAVFAGIFVVSLIMSLVKVPLPNPRRFKSSALRSLLSNLSRVIHGWSYIVSHRRLMLQLISLTFFNLGLVMATTFIIIKSLHFSVGFVALMLFSVLGTFSVFINITPANLGVKEAIYLFSSAILGFSLNQIVLIALVDRGILFLVLLLMWLLSSYVRGKGGLKIPEPAGSAQ